MTLSKTKAHHYRRFMFSSRQIFRGDGGEEVDEQAVADEGAHSPRRGASAPSSPYGAGGGALVILRSSLSPFPLLSSPLKGSLRKTLAGGVYFVSFVLFVIR